MDKDLSNLYLDPPKKSLLGPLLIGFFLILVFAASLAVAYLFGKSQTQSLSTTEPVPTTEVVSADVSTWTNHTSPNNTYSLQYPSSWYVYYSDASSIVLSDASEPYKIPAEIDPQGHSLIRITENVGNIPDNILYTNSSEVTNPTLKAFTLNSYSGIRANVSSILGSNSAEEVDLTNPNGGYVTFQKELDPTGVFDQILSTFKFLRP